MPTHRDVASFIESLAPPMGREEGFRFGDPSGEATGVLVCFMATTRALAAAVEHSCSLVVCHEQLNYPYESWGVGLEQSITWSVNRRRFTALARGGLTVYRAHGQADRFSIVDDFRRLLELPEPTVRDGLRLICEIEPVTVRDLAARVKRRTGLGSVRVAGNLDTTVRRVAPAVGGLGLSLNIGYLETVLDLRPDVLIAGECDEYAWLYLQDAGVPVIETAHCTSENPGLGTLTRVLQHQFPGIPVVFHEVECPWVVV